jgi:hypothetical protein
MHDQGESIPFQHQLIENDGNGLKVRCKENRRLIGLMSAVPLPCSDYFVPSLDGRQHLTTKRYRYEGFTTRATPFATNGN